MFENLVVIGRINERIALLRAEVQKRGMRWADAEVEEAGGNADKNMTNGDGRLVNGDGLSNGSHTAVVGGGQAQSARAQSGRLTDEELMAQMQERMGQDDEDDGVHL